MQINIHSAIDNTGHSGGHDLTMTAPLVDISAPIHVKDSLTITGSSGITAAAGIQADKTLIIDTPTLELHTTSPIAGGIATISTPTKVNVHTDGSVQTAFEPGGKRGDGQYRRRDVV